MNGGCVVTLQNARSRPTNGRSSRATVQSIALVATHSLPMLKVLDEQPDATTPEPDSVVSSGVMWSREVKADCWAIFRRWC